MTVLIDIAYLIALIAISPVAIYKMLRYGRYRAGWANRFGKISRKRPDKKCIWIHAVSVGEVNATTTLIRELESQIPQLRNRNQHNDRYGICPRKRAVRQPTERVLLPDGFFTYDETGIREISIRRCAC